MKKAIASILSLALTFGALPLPVLAAPGDVGQTLVTPMELPVEIEIELSPAGSLKQAPLWKELYQLIQDPYSPVQRRPGFGVAMPPLNVYPLDYNFLTGQPMRLKTVNGEISWDLPGPLFDPAEVVPVDAFNTPTALRTPIGALVGSDDDILDPGEVDGTTPCTTCGYLIVSNPGPNPVIPPDGTIVAVPALVGGILQELVLGTNDTEDLLELEAPINEEDFFRDPTDTAGVAPALQPYIGRLGAEVLGKAAFWDMQVGSDGVQACGSCHFNGGADNRTRNQLNPNHLGGDVTLQIAGPNLDVQPSDFPFHKRINPDVAGDGLLNPAVVVSDANDVMSSMGVVFRTFVDIPSPGPTAFAPAVNGVAPLLPDIGTPDPDPLGLVFQGVRRVEPRNTPTFHGAAFNFDNFWDGRARFNFNGGSVFGPSDPQFHVFIDEGIGLEGLTNAHLRPELVVENPEAADQPVRIKFSSLASQAVGPPLSEFEMSFFGRNWPKIGKKLLQSGVTPLANQLVATDDSRLGEFSNQGGAVCAALGRPTAVGTPGLCVTYPELIRVAFTPEYWSNSSQHLNGTSVSLTDQPAAGGDPFDGYVLSIAGGACTGGCLGNTNQFSQMEANFSLFFGLSVQAYESLTIPDDTPADRFFDANPTAGHGVGEPGDQAVLFPTLVPDLLDDGLLNNSAAFPTPGVLNLIPDDPSTPEYDGFGPDEIFGFDVFAGANLTAGLPVGNPRNPQGFGSNPFARSAKCMLCHLGPEQTDHSINVSHGLLKNDAEFEYPTPPFAADPGAPDNCFFADCLLPAPEPSGSSRTVGGLILAEEVEEAAQDAVEVEPRNFANFDDPATPWDDRLISQPSNFAFGDQGIYNIGLRPSAEDSGRGGSDPFSWPLSLSALALMNIAGNGGVPCEAGGPCFDPCDGPTDSCVMANVDPLDLGLTFEETGEGLEYPDAPGYTLQSINPGLERSPTVPMLPDYMVPWMHGLPAGELHPQIDELAGMAPNTLTPPNGGPAIEFPEIIFGADEHCGVYDPVSLGGAFSDGPPAFGWGPALAFLGPNPCPNNQSGVTGNFDFPVHGTWPVPNRVLRDGAFKAPSLRNVELTGPYFHTGSYLTLRQVIDFYMRGGDFPLTNAESRDPNIQDIEEQAFGFGRTTGADLETLISHVFSVDPPFTLEGYFIDGLPDTAFRYDTMPDTDHPLTPEPVTSTPEEAKNALVKFLLALTDPRVKYERAPFDRPEIFVPVDGTAPDNTGGRAQLLAMSSTTSPSCPTGNMLATPFRRVPAVGAGGNAVPVRSFLNISAMEGYEGADHFDSVTDFSTEAVSSFDLVTSFYLNSLGRLPEPGALTAWTTEINRIVSLGIDRREAFIALGMLFFQSDEYLLMNTTDTQFVTDLYMSFLGRMPEAAGLAHWLDQLALGLTRSMLVLHFGVSLEFNNCLDATFGVIAARPENAFLNDLYRGLLGRLPDSAGFDLWLAELRTAQCSGPQAVIDFASQLAVLFIQSEEYGLRNRSNTEFIEDIYNAILGRSADPAGFLAWIAALDTMTREEVLMEFTASPEFQLRVQAIINAGCVI